MYKLTAKLFVLMLFFALLGCQESDEVISPETNPGENQSLEKFTMTEINLNNTGENTCIELVAGRQMVIGEVCVDYIESTNKLKVTYTITDPNWTIVKTHVAAVIHPFLFPRKWNLLPRLSRFPYKGTHENVTSVEYMVDVPSWYDITYLAIHAKVEGSNLPGDAVIEPSLPATDVLTPSWRPSGADYTVQCAYDNFGTYPGWGIDNQRYISSGVARDITFISSYSEDLPMCTSFIENVDKLPYVNWIINHREPTWDRLTVQAAIWSLVDPDIGIAKWQDPNHPNYFEHDAQLREQIVAAALANGEDYEPGCGDKVLILAYGPETDPCDLSTNIVGFEFPVECQTENLVKHAWAYPFVDGQPVQDLSRRFSWIGRARFVKYDLR
jgi:hypothetical protein